MKILVTSWPGEYESKHPYQCSNVTSIGGAEIQVKKITEGLSLFANVIYASLTTGKLSPSQNIDLYHKPRESTGQNVWAEYCSFLVEVLEKTIPDVILSYLIYPCSDAVALALARAKLPTPPIFGAISGSREWLGIQELPEKKLLIPKKHLLKCLGSAGLFFSSSSTLRRELSTRTVAPILTIRPVIDWIPKERSCLTHSQSPIVVCHGRLAPPKRWDITLSAFHEGLVTETLPADTTLLLIGDGPDRQSLERMILLINKDVGPRVKYLGRLPQELILKYLQQASAGVYLSSNEGYGSAPVEAMLCGVPTVISGFTDVIDDFKNSALCIPCSMTSSDVLKRLLIAMKTPRVEPRQSINEAYSKTRIAAKIFNAADSMIII